MNIVAHSWGTVISWLVLSDGVGTINTWVTMGSPLPAITPRPRNLGKWINIITPDDPVSNFSSIVGVRPLYEKPEEDGIVHIWTEGWHDTFWTDSRTINTIGTELNKQ